LIFLQQSEVIEVTVKFPTIIESKGSSPLDLNDFTLHNPLLGDPLKF